MDQPRQMRLYLDPSLRDSALSGQHNFLKLVTGVLAAHGYAVEVLPTGPGARAKAPTLPGYALFHMEHPTHDRAFCFRRVYHYPFWAIEPVAERWNWRVARTPFPVAQVNRQMADAFHARWGRRLFGTAPQEARRDGFVYVPLQGRLLSHRSFQQCAPVEMLERVLAQEPRRRILATLHPREQYTKHEVGAVEGLAHRFPRLELVARPMADCLRDCDYVVTQNSSAAFNGFFFGKPAMLFAKVDFHHITLGPDAFDRIAGHAPDFAGYTWWFWQKMSINAGREDAPRRIVDALRRCGLPLPDAVD